MPPAALGFILCAAIFHAGWNLFVKQAQNQQVFLMWATLSTLLCFPLLLLLPPLPLQAWPFVLGSALAEALYIITLAWAYAIGDFSLVYPIARGAAPILLTVWAMLFLKEKPGAFGLVGIAVLVVGLMVVGAGASWKTLRATTLSLPAIGVALLTATFISIYGAIDGAAVHLVDPRTYVIWVFGLAALFVTPFIMHRYGAQLATKQLREQWPRILLVGVLIVITYGMVLFAYTMGRVSYAGSIREVSIVFGALMGWRFLGEGLGLMRTIGALLIFAGIVVIALWG
ncbi:MAG TPA: EamA family transporter [Ktedonosporobacter sp.]|nr:EamA family transporter [Ktedonosporobacter sp.]